MMSKRFSQFLWGICILMTASLACKTITGAIQESIAVIDTATLVATPTQLSQQLTETAAATATGDLGGGMLGPLQPMMTEIGGILPEFGLGGPEVTGEPPPDIPIISGEKEDLVTAPNKVSYSITMALNDVVSFYEREMPAREWVKQPGQPTPTNDRATLLFTKGNRTATIRIEIDFLFGDTTTVDITITGG
jgi:hypothetical protein